MEACLRPAPSMGHHALPLRSSHSGAAGAAGVSSQPLPWAALHPVTFATEQVSPGAVVTRRESVHGNRLPQGFPPFLPLPRFLPPANRLPASRQGRPLSGPRALTSQVGEAGPEPARSGSQRSRAVGGGLPPFRLTAPSPPLALLR